MHEDKLNHVRHPDELLRQLALRMEVRVDEVRKAIGKSLFLGTSPPELPAGLLLFDDLEILGTNIGAHATSICYVNSSRPSDSVLEAMSQYLLAAGWQQLANLTRPPAHGFPVDTAQSMRPPEAVAMQGMFVRREFVNRSGTVMLRLSFWTEGEKTEIDIEISTNAGDIDTYRKVLSVDNRILALLPPLSPPPGTTAFAGNGMWGRTMAHQAVRLMTTLDIATMGEYLASQLEAAGWRPVSTSTAPDSWRSDWSFTHPEYGSCKGTLELSTLEDAPGLEASLAAEREVAGPHPSAP